MTDELIREVDEAMKYDRAKQAWDTHGKTLILLAALCIVLIGGFSYWQHQQEVANEQWTAHFLEARDAFKAGRYDEAKQTYEKLVTNSSGAQAQMAGIWLAKTQLRLANQEGVLDALDGVVKSDEKKEQPALVVMACLQGAALAPEDARFQACLPQKPDAALKPLVDEHRSIMLMAKGDYKAAQAALPKGSLPPAQQARVDDMSSYLASKNTHDE